VSKDELEAGRPKGPHGGPPDLAEMLTKLDTDGDGNITKAEFDAGAPASSASPASTTSSTEASTESSGDAASQLLDLLKKMSEEFESDASSSRDRMMAFLLKLQETGAVAA
jgi:hypothetical protein